MRRRTFIAGLGGAAAWSMTGRAQQADRVRRFGVLMVQEETNPEAQGWLVALRDGLEKLGWTEGQNIKFEYYWVAPDSNLIQQAAKQLVAVQPDLILASSTPGIAALLQGTSTIPILFPNIVDPVGSGFATSLSRPGRNATGLVNLEASMAGKWLGLLKEVAPRVTRLVVPFNPATSPYAQIYLDYFTSSGASLGVQVITAPVANITELETFAAAQAREPNTGLIPVPGAFMSGHVAEIADIVARCHLPSIHYSAAFAKAGGLLSYGNNIADNYRRTATFADRILKGEKPSDIPIQFPVKFELVINIKAAEALGLKVLPSLLATADEVIE